MRFNAVVLLLLSPRVTLDPPDQPVRPVRRDRRETAERLDPQEDLVSWDLLDPPEPRERRVTLALRDPP